MQKSAKSKKFKNTAILPLILLTIAIHSASCFQPQRRILVGTAGRGKWTEETKPVKFEITTSIQNWDPIGVFFGVIWKLVTLVCIVMMLFDMVSRLLGKPRKFLGLFRFLVFNYGMVNVVYLGRFQTLVYRGILEFLWEEWYDQAYGDYFGSGYFKVFGSVKNNAGRPFPNFFHFINVYFVELLVFVIFLIATLALRSKLKHRWAIAHFFASFKTVWFISFMFPFIHWVILFYKQHGLIKQNIKKGESYERGTFVYIFGFGVATWMLWEATNLIISMVLTNIQFSKDPIGFPKSKHRRKGYREAPRQNTNNQSGGPRRSQTSNVGASGSNPGQSNVTQSGKQTTNFRS
jgi:hypothetical protein